ncbi:MAG: tetratricopeptide repeat protein [Candidatus Omnitrophica bacterium]|nr:tetratricopeptide repeat protein [Candidatus Omnitrophota bacterium]MCM8793352.1 tetratricopeptide repeat protein [Candidatus Omnitrophota bacterium]
MGKWKCIILNILLSISFLLTIPLFAEERLFSEEVKNYRKIAYSAYQEGDWDKAYQFFKKAILLAPDNPISHNDLGVIYEIRGLKELAIKEYLEAINLNPHYPAPYMNLALLYNDLGEREKAIFYLKERLKRGKKNDPWYKKARALLEHWEVEISSNSSERKELTSSPSYDDNPVKPEKTPPLTGEENFVVNEVERAYQEGRRALLEGNFGLVMEKIDYLLKFNPIDKENTEILSKTEKERFIQETQEEEPIVLHFP